MTRLHTRFITQLIFLIFSVNFIRCSGNKTYLFDEGGNDKTISSKLISYDASFMNDGKQYFEFRLNSWKGYVDSSNIFIPEFGYSGLLTKDGDKIFYQRNFNGSRSLFFDFNMKKGDSIFVHNNFLFKRLQTDWQDVSKEYFLIVEDKIVKGNNDTIFKIVFRKFNFIYPNDNLGFYVSRKSGILLVFVSLIKDNIECIYRYVGDKKLMDPKTLFCPENIM
jgi:hypothetical protein